MKTKMMAMAAVFAAVAAQAAWADVVVAPSLGSVLVKASVGPGEASEVDLYRCSSVENGIPDKGSCKFANSGYANVPVQFLAPGSYLLELSGSFYPDMVTVSSGNQTVIQASQLKIGDDPAIDSFEIAYDLTDRSTQNLLLKFYWGLAPDLDRIERLCSASMAQGNEAAAACHAWEQDDYQSLRNSVIRFVSDGTYKKLGRMKVGEQETDEYCNDWGDCYTETIPILLTEFGQKHRWTQDDAAESGDNLALFPAVYDLIQELPGGDEQVTREVVR